MENFSIAPEKIDPLAKVKDDCESAKILMREGLREEAKKILFRALTIKPDDSTALFLLNQIEQEELKEIFNSEDTTPKIKVAAVEDVDLLISHLERDLHLEESEKGAEKEKFNDSIGLVPRELLDLAIAYVEMECYSDALRELKKAEKKIRREETFLGEVGLTTASLISQCLVKLDRAYEAKSFLEPILLEDDLKHEDKAMLYYEMGCVEQRLENFSAALEWFKKVLMITPHLKETTYRIKLLTQKLSKKK